MDFSSNSLSYRSNTSTQKKELRGNIIFRQELKNYIPKCDANCGIIYFTILFVFFVGCGLPILITALNIQEIIMEYTDCTTKLCTVSFTLTKQIKKPSYLYYEIHNFYMNQRDFVNSKSFAQLRGDVHIDSSDNDICEGAKYLYEMFDNDSSKYFTYTGNSLKGEDYANPCGLIAKSMFNDTNFILRNSQGREIKINDTDITNDYYRKYMFKKIKNSTSIQWMDVTNEHFIIWMQMEPMEIFRKLWGRIEIDLPPDKYTITLENNWDVLMFSGKKKLILTGSSKIGTGKFYGIVLLGGAGYCLIIIVVLLYLKSKHNGRVYKKEDLKWN